MCWVCVDPEACSVIHEDSVRWQDRSLVTSSSTTESLRIPRGLPEVGVLDSVQCSARPAFDSLWLRRPWFPTLLIAGSIRRANSLCSPHTPHLGLLFMCFVWLNLLHSQRMDLVPRMSLHQVIPRRCLMGKMPCLFSVLLLKQMPGRTMQLAELAPGALPR